MSNIHYVSKAQNVRTSAKYSGIPKVMLNGNVIPRAIGIKSPGSAFGAASFIAAGTAMYDALDASNAIINRSPVSVSTKRLSTATQVPLTMGKSKAMKAAKRP
jgi:hypothetical protein